MSMTPTLEEMCEQQKKQIAELQTTVQQQKTEIGQLHRQAQEFSKKELIREGEVKQLTNCFEFLAEKLVDKI